jgi:hypothetical protein
MTGEQKRFAARLEADRKRLFANKYWSALYTE